jgi:hypothetical protein
VEFVKESLVFTSEESPMANPMLSVMGAFAEFERSLIKGRQGEALPLAKQRAAYKGRKKTLTPGGVAELVQRPAVVFRKPSLPASMGSAGRLSVSTCATPSWREALLHRYSRQPTQGTTTG